MLNKLLISITFSLSLTFTQAQNSWTSKAGSPVERERATAFTIGNYGYVGTGVGGGRLRNDFWRYDPETDTWSEIDTMPTLGRRGAFSFPINNRGYVGGGVNENSLTDDEFWEYDPAQSKWLRKVNLPHGLVYADETLVGFSIGNEGYLLASFSRSNFYMYSPTTNTWSSRANFPGNKALGQVGFTIGGKGYVGSGSGMDYITEFWEYDPVTNQWSKKADVPGKPRSDAVGFSIGNYGYVGLGLNHSYFQHDFWEYHPLTDTWIQIDSCHYAAWYAVGIGIGSKGYLGTGIRFSHDSGWWEYTPNISSVNDIGQSEKIRVFPNPLTDILKFDSNGPEIKTFSIYSVHGQLVKTGVATDHSIPVAELPEGVYILKLFTADKVMSKKFIKE
ncbi:MAG: T9SS C-terminal target domain-containing protein [Porphyromonadaceae bacterium]|nr:MAG: T9SS C-terminal target domain-containing protein [Porphyromonadaceae bacterium]